ncbi:hypothetical protein BWX35_23650, partial [Escherichia coli]
SLKTSIKTITYLSDIGCLEIQGASLKVICVRFQSYIWTQIGLCPCFLKEFTDLVLIMMTH